jgi:phosphoglycolate phosphatase-like HAD superfamily hydrolase
MTATRTADPQLVRVLDHAHALLLDFDGPICSAFHGANSAAAVAAAVRRAVQNRTDVAIPTTDDPFDVLRALAAEPEAYALADAALAERELAAAATASPTPGILDVIDAAHDAGLRLAVVSNNSHPAIAAALGRLLDGRPPLPIYGRGGPDSLKPSPALVFGAISGLGISPRRAVLLGDSTTDVLAAHRAGAAAIGYANKPGKRLAIEQVCADAVIDGLADLLPALPSRRRLIG